MRRALVILLFLLLATTPETLAKGAVWSRKWVGVFDYSSSAWNFDVYATVNEFNAMLPKRAPRLVYFAMTATPCDQLNPGQHRSGIVVCMVDSLPSAFQLGLTEFLKRGRTLERVRISLPEEVNPALRANTVCHEFMHAVTGIRDNYGALPDTSCVWGNLTDPGSFDAQYARNVYKKKKR